MLENFRSIEKLSVKIISFHAKKTISLRIWYIVTDQQKATSAIPLQKNLINNWVHDDTLGMLILPQFLKYNVVDYTDFISWLTSRHKFQRWSVSVTLIKLLKSKTIDDFSVVFSFLKPLMTDPEREVHQGMGWFLREA